MTSKLGILRIANQSADVLYTWQGSRLFITNLDNDSYDILSKSPWKQDQITLELGNGQEREIEITQANRNTLTKIFKCEAKPVA